MDSLLGVFELNCCFSKRFKLFLRLPYLPWGVNDVTYSWSYVIL